MAEVIDLGLHFEKSHICEDCASFHVHFNGCFYAAHSNIYDIIGNPLRVQCLLYDKMLDVHKNKKEARVATLITRFDSGALPLPRNL